MNCDPLPGTGLGAYFGIFLIVAIACLVVGATMLLVTRSRRRGAAATLLMLFVVGAAVMIGPSAPAQAVTVDCVTADNSLTVTQTSALTA